MGLGAIVRHYIRHYRKHSEAELAWFRRQDAIEDALRLAAYAEDANRHRFSHQYRIRQNAMDRAHRKLVAEASRLPGLPNFARLLERIAALLGPIAGLGELYVYDTSLRIGARLGKMPEAVYLHAGARVGAAALGLTQSTRMLLMGEVPAELRELEPHEVEDVLCIYKGVLGRAYRGEPLDLPENDWCYRDDPEEYEDVAMRQSGGHKC